MHSQSDPPLFNLENPQNNFRFLGM